MSMYQKLGQEAPDDFDFSGIPEASYNPMTNPYLQEGYGAPTGVGAGLGAGAGALLGYLLRDRDRDEGAGAALRGGLLGAGLGGLGGAGYNYASRAGDVSDSRNAIQTLVNTLNQRGIPHPLG